MNGVSHILSKFPVMCESGREGGLVVRFIFVPLGYLFMKLFSLKNEEQEGKETKEETRERNRRENIICE